MGSYVQAGDVIDYTPGSAVAAGEVVVLGDLVAIAPRAIAANEVGALALEGIWDVPKESGTASGSTAGTVYYWDAGNEVATTDSDSGTNKQIGHSVADADAGDETVRIRLER